MSEIVEVKSAEIMEAINRSEIDVQITTAKAYPRNLEVVQNKILTYATMDTETAEECFYALRREGERGTQVIEGISVRLAEIIASCWGNIRVQTRIIGNDGKTITAQGTCHDLETNHAVQTEVRRRITNKYGRTYSEDMQVVTGNAAAAIAFRNAVLKVVPKAVIKRILQEIKKVALGQSLDVETSRQNIISYFAKIGVKEQMIYDYLGVGGMQDIDKEKIFELRATANAIKEGTTTVQETFMQPQLEKSQAEEALKKAKELKSKAEEAQKKQQELNK